MSDRCFTCHGPDEKARKKKLRLDTKEGIFKELDDGNAVVKPSHPEKSELVRRIFAEDDDLMPPEKSNLKLTAAEKDLLKRWVAEGAEFKQHWSFIPVQAIDVPKVRNATKNPIDSFVRARLETEGLKPSPEASRETLIRRLAFDLTGLPPTLAEIDAFLADESPDAYQKVVDHYLSKPAYGERMAKDWLDLARYADTYGYQTDVERDLSPWRDWVIGAFNQNLSYDKFITWQIAGDLLPNATREQRLATAFNRLHRQTNEGGSVEEEFRVEYVSDRVNTVSTAVLGLTMECARCHDHKYDPIKQRDYYAMSAFFNSIDESGLYSHYTRSVPTPTLLLWPQEKEAKEQVLKGQIAEAETKLKKIATDSNRAYRQWLKDDGHVQAPQPVAYYPFEKVNKGVTLDSVTGTNKAKLVDGPKLVPGRTGNALLFSGDNELNCEHGGHFRRTDEFSFGLWLKPTEKQDRAVVLHHSRSWTDAGSRGYELVLHQGRPFFGLIHFWPGDAIGVRAKSGLPTNEWSHVAITYDGSSRAGGIKLFVNGVAIETEVVRDHLFKDIIHRSEWGDSETGAVRLSLAGRNRDSGFKNGLIDEFQVFDTCLTEPEVKQLLATGRSTDEVSAPVDTARGETPTLQYFLARHHEPYRAALAELKKLREQENDLINDVREIMTMEELPKPRATFVLKRGAYDSPGDPVERDTPVSILAFPADQPRNRLGLAHWMVDRKNPLTARVIVNRIWRMHFGRGIVATQENFGSQGRLPTHPDLLDWLASWFMDNGWDVKALHRLIVSSATYKQSSMTTRDLTERDPDNILLARGPKFRLQAEEIRDSALAASGILNAKIGGPSVKPYQPAGLWEQSGTGKTYTQDHGDALYRRSLYTFWRRTAPPPSMLTFDATTREVCTAKRETTATPLQALVLLNDPQFVETARVLGERLLKENPKDVDARIRTAFRTLTSRNPDAKEIGVLHKLYDEQRDVFERDSAAAEKFLSTGESAWDKSLPRAEFAATATVVSAVMNFDEFVMER